MPFRVPRALLLPLLHLVAQRETQGPGPAAGMHRSASAAAAPFLQKARPCGKAGLPICWERAGAAAAAARGVAAAASAAPVSRGYRANGRGGSRGSSSLLVKGNKKARTYAVVFK